MTSKAPMVASNNVKILGYADWDDPVTDVAGGGLPVGTD